MEVLYYENLVPFRSKNEVKPPHRNCQYHRRSGKETIAIRTDVPLMQEIKKGLMVLKTKKARLYRLNELIG